MTSGVNAEGKGLTWDLSVSLEGKEFHRREIGPSCF